MLVSELMSTDLATVTPDASVSKAFQILYERKHSQLPVVEGEKLVGLITEKLLAEVSPSKATTLSVFEINYLLSKTKVLDIMKKNVFTISPDSLIEEAALIMYNNDIGSLPVIKNDKTLVGIVTRLDIFKAFIEIMGVRDEGTRIALEVNEGVGIIATISNIFKEHNISIRHISNYDRTDENVEIVVRVETKNIECILPDLEKNGFKVTSVMKS